MPFDPGVSCEVLPPVDAHGYTNRHVDRCGDGVALSVEPVCSLPAPCLLPCLRE